MTSSKKVNMFYSISIVLFVCIFLSGCITIYTNEISSESESLFPETNNTNDEDTCLTLYRDCLSWQETSKAIGQSTCFVGRISKVFYERDEVSGLYVSDAYFDPNAAKYSDSNGVYQQTTGLVLSSIDNDLSYYEGKCVAVFGKITDSDYINNPRAMIDIDPYDDRAGFRISDCKCP